MMKRLLNSVLLITLTINFLGQNNYVSFEKVGKEYDTVSNKNGPLIMKGDIYKSGKFIYLNNQNEFISSYQNRYSYLNGHKELTYFKSTAIANDTSSISVKNIYLDINPAYFTDKITPISYLKKDPVSNQEWNDFQRYIYDSIMYRLYSREISDDYLTPTFTQQGYGKEELDQGEWNINWNKKLPPTNGRSMNWEYRSIMSYMYYPPSERFRSVRKVDQRKLNYKYYEVQNDQEFKNLDVDKLELQPLLDSVYITHRSNYHLDPMRDIYSARHTPSYTDSLSWKLQCTDGHNGDISEQLVENYKSSIFFKDQPVVGVTSQQAKGYLNWLQTNHQQKLNKDKSWYYVEYNLPTPLELASIPEQNKKVTIESFDMEPWRITNQNYKEFIDYVADSIAIRIIIQEYDLYKFLIPTLDDYGQEADEYSWLINWKSRKSIYKDEEFKEHLNNSGYFYPEYLKDKSLKRDIDYRRLDYEFYNINYSDASKLGDFVKTTRYNYNECSKPSLELQLDSTIDDRNSIGKNLLLSETNNKCQNADVRSHNNVGEYIVQNLVSIYPGAVCAYDQSCSRWDRKSDTCCSLFPEYNDKRLPNYDFDSNPSESVNNITYDQAFAYYNWLIKVKGAIVKGENQFFKNYIPSEEEWLKIQDNQKVIHPAETFALPTPRIFYTVKFYPRKKEFTRMFSNVQLNSNHNGARESASSTQRKAYLKAINCDQIERVDKDERTYYLIKEKKTNLWGAIYADGDVLLPLQYYKIDIINDSINNYIKAYNSYGKVTSVILPSYVGDIVSNRFFDSVVYILEEGEQIATNVLVQDNGKWGEYIPNLNIVASPCEYETPDQVPLADAYRFNYLMEYINPRQKKGDDAFKPDGNGDGVFYARNSNKKWGLYQMNQNIIPAEYDSINTIGYNTPFTIVWNNGKAGVYKSFFGSPSLSVPCIYEDAKRIRGNRYYLAVKKEGKWGYVDWYNGKELSKFIYNSYDELPDARDYPSEYYK